MSVTYPSLQFTTFPDQIQTFVTMLNMAIADAPAIKGYQEAMQAGNNALAQQYYSQITNANRKFIDATKMNTLMDTCIALQKFYSTDIQPYIENLQVGWTNTIDQFSYLGDYTTGTTYQRNNFVTYTVNGVKNVYICTKEMPTSTPPTNTTYWRKLSIQGIQGPSGENLSFRYGWSSAEVYYPEDVVVYNNVVWGCTIENSNQTPQSGSNYWYVIYTPQQVIYPFSEEEPLNMESGYLWFKIKGEG